MVEVPESSYMDKKVWLLDVLACSLTNVVPVDEKWILSQSELCEGVLSCRIVLKGMCKVLFNYLAHLDSVS